MLDRVPKIFTNFFFVTSILFLAWMFFFDSNDFINQARMRNKLSALEREREFYQEKITEVELERTALFNDPVLLEKFARERYLMKRPNEEVYVVVRE